MKYIYTKELLEPIILESKSLREVLLKLKIVAVGGNYATLKKKIAEFNIDISHFTGLRWNKGEFGTDRVSLYALKDILQKGTNYKSHNLKLRLILEGIKENYCEECKISGKEVPLELHHIDGNHYNNFLDNLQILCPNCHSKTPNFRNRNHRDSIEIKEFRRLQKPKCICQNCHKEFYSDRIDKSRKFCSRRCYNEYLAKGNICHNYNNEEFNNIDLSKEHLIQLCEIHSNITDIADTLHISRPTIRKYLIKYNLYEKFKMKYDFHAKIIEQYDKNLVLIKEWPSIKDAADSLNIVSSDISKCALHKKRSAGGYIWKYKEG